MKVTIDEKACKKHKMTLSEAIVALAIRCREENDIPNMLKKEMLVKKDGQYYITQPWSDALDKVIAESSNKVKNVEEYYNLAEELRKIYPKGAVPGTSSTIYRGNKAEVARKLQSFFLQYGEYSDEEIIDATKKYIESLHGDYSFLKTLKYFILKNEVKKDEDGSSHVEVRSYLADFLENDGDVEVSNENWKKYARN